MNETKHFTLSIPLPTRHMLGRLLHWLTPNGGTLLLLVAFLFAQSVGALPLPMRNAAPAWPAAPTINYQGRLADSAGNPINDTVAMQFALYDAATDGSVLWGPESHPTVPVSEGLFSIGLGSQTAGGIPTSILSGDVWLEITVDGETLMPRELLRAAPYAMQASVALTVPDSSIGAAKLNIDEDLDLHSFTLTNTLAIESANAQNFVIANYYGRMRVRSANDLYVFLDTDNNQTNAVFKIYHDNSRLEPPVQGLLTLDESGNLSVIGNVSQGAMIENNLQTPAEFAAERIARFSEGDVLCWGNNRLELCAQSGDPLVQAVADENGKPIVIGAEVIKVLGPVQRGDLLVASDVPGYAVAIDDPAPGTVIAQALADFAGERGVVKAMVRKF
ncbi:MAG TPA: hypothetical protein PKH77_00775 [Anaerolineae bacterium]|nr:hypothetical protein [Anaerolineae bacterium]